MKSIYNLYKINLNIENIKTNSKEIEEGDIFACVKGNSNRHDFVNEAIEKGARILIVSKKDNYKIPYIKVKNVDKELIKILKFFYNDYLNINLIGVTGTDGKTTTATIIRDMLENTAYIGTNGVISDRMNEPLNNTTPSIEKTYYYLNRLYKEGIKNVAIEASSEGLLNNRLEGLKFKRAILTNITEDHLNVHKTIDNYIKCKRKLFNKLSNDGIAILNRDDIYYNRFKTIKNKKLTYGKNRYSTLRIINFKEKENQTIIKYRYKHKEYEVVSPLLGEFNVYNLSAAILTLLSYSIDFNNIKSLVNKVKTPSGRVEFLDYNQDYKIIIDYAHTENGIKNILTFLNKIKRNRIITVTGAAGGREVENRSKKGKVLQSLSDIVIYTMDDPRYEKVLDIIDMMVDKRRDNYIIEENREIAIQKALDIAKTEDIVAILGKGRDKYMAIKDYKIYYSDINVLDKYFKEL